MATQLIVFLCTSHLFDHAYSCASLILRLKRAHGPLGVRVCGFCIAKPSLSGIMCPDAFLLRLFVYCGVKTAVPHALQYTRIIHALFLPGLCAVLQTMSQNRLSLKTIDKGTSLMIVKDISVKNSIANFAVPFQHILCYTIFPRFVKRFLLLSGDT